MKFREQLPRVMAREDHRARPLLSGPGSTRRQILIHSPQESLACVRDFHRFPGRVRGACPDASARRLPAGNPREKETRGLSGTGPHPGLFLYMMDEPGFRRLRFKGARPLFGASRHRSRLDRVTTRQSWVLGAAVITILVNGSVHDRSAVDAEREQIHSAVERSPALWLRHREDVAGAADLSPRDRLRARNLGGRA